MKNSEYISEYKARVEAEEFEIVEDFRLISASEISLELHDLDNLWPEEGEKWHGHTQADFEELDQMMVKYFAPEHVICDEDEVIKDIYIRNPIIVVKDKDKYVLREDGRHRVLAAQKHNSLIPVIAIGIVPYMSFDDYIDAIIKAAIIKNKLDIGKL